MGHVVAFKKPQEALEVRGIPVDGLLASVLGGKTMNMILYQVFKIRLSQAQHFPLLFFTNQVLKWGRNFGGFVKIEGRLAYHPRMMLKILIYAYSQKTPSSWAIARRCGEDVVFMWLSGRQKPDFRKNNIKVLKKLFKQVVQICQRLGMVSLGLVAIDGTKPAIGGQR
ncbi:hypothetical protein ES703_107564 [subsurface metagenome]